MRSPPKACVRNKVALASPDESCVLSHYGRGERRDHRGGGTSVKFITRAQLVGFRCYETFDVELDHVNVFIGPNNAGKSAVLRAIRRLASVNLNRHERVAERAGVGFLASSSSYRLEAGDMRDGENVSRLVLNVSEQLPLTDGVDRASRISARFDPQRGTTLWADDEPEPPKPDTVSPRAEGIVSSLDDLPIVVIPETRGLPRWLPLGNQQDDTRFHEEVVDAARLLPALIEWACGAPHRIDAFVATAGELLGLSVQVAADPRRSMVLVRIGDDRARALDQLGAGVTEVLTLSAALTIYDRGLLLYEEPELHLHPRVQRRIVAKLRERARSAPWQVLLTTHSNHILDHGLDDDVGVFSVSRADGVSRTERVVPASRRGDVHAVFDQLGVRPSSGLQPQVLVWVEGPSDATYLRFLIGVVDEDLSEYVDYSFAFFGGSLLKHHAASAVVVEHLVDMVGIHRNSVVVFDSDRVKTGAPLGKAYATVFQERSEEGRLWTTWGREVENYLHEEVLCWAAGNKTPMECREHLRNIDRRHAVFANQVTALRDALGRKVAYQDASEQNKVKFAAAAVEHMKQGKRDWLEVGDLRVRVQQLCAFIRKAGA